MRPASRTPSSRHSLPFSLPGVPAEERPPGRPVRRRPAAPRDGGRRLRRRDPAGRPGQEGLAYLLENLMFQGSENISPLQHIAFVQKVGGELNATTTPDKALFYETLPSNQLALALWLESDRMKSLAITPAAIERTRSELVSRTPGPAGVRPLSLGRFAQFDTLLFPDDLYGHPLIGDGLRWTA
ncbi:MAG: insulinase family protein [Desulfobacterales bacterium]|nr:insulinase family protein [Desulfobacterales bacterium]